MKLALRIGIALVLLGSGLTGGYIYSQREQQPFIEFVRVGRRDIVQEVDVTGRVTPDEFVDLAFERSGKVVSVNVKVGDRVKKGQRLAVLNASDLYAQKAAAEAERQSAKAMKEQYEASLAMEQARLDELTRGARPEERGIAQTRVVNAERSLQDAILAQENMRAKTLTDVQAVSVDALSSSWNAVEMAKRSLLVLTDMQYAHFISSEQQDVLLAEAKSRAVLSLLGKEDAGRLAGEFINGLHGGMYGLVQERNNARQFDDIDVLLSQVILALSDVEYALNAVPITDELLQSERVSLNTEKNSLIAQVSMIKNKKEALDVQRALNATSLSTAQSAVTMAQNALSEAQDNLKQVEAGTSVETLDAQKARLKQSKALIASQEARIRQTQAQIQQVDVVLTKTVLSAPFDGVVSKKDIQVGEIITANMPIFSLITVAQVEIEAFIPEVDISKVRQGGKAEFTLDAYGRDVVFNAEVFSIDPAETLVDGVPTYRTVLYPSVLDDRIKPGMTANLTISGERREGVLALPRRAIFNEDGIAQVKIWEGEGIRILPIQVGLLGTDGSIEIISGLNEGDQVILSIEEVL